MKILNLLAARYFLMAYAGILVFMLFPVAIMLLASALGTLFGCPAEAQYSNEVCTNGDLIYGLSQAGWLLVITLPVGLLLLGGVILLNILFFLFTKKKALLAGMALNQVRKKFRK